MTERAADRALVDSLRGVFADDAKRDRYISDGWHRVQTVLGLLERLKAEGVSRVLELGANPYVMTTLIRHRIGLEMELANYFGEDRNALDCVDAAELNGKPVEFRYRHFNIERDRFPYDDSTFDCVLFCEIIEHLLASPDQSRPHCRGNPAHPSTGRLRRHLNAERNASPEPLLPCARKEHLGMVFAQRTLWAAQPGVQLQRNPRPT